ncbi:MAG: hypothetical protein PHI77_03580 [Candidatus Pacebacteria bacterium]|nr:hypothetical protein [Candidatus Paceibacterota bacterium]
MDALWYTITSKALSELWEGFILFIPNFLVALIIFIIGWLVSLGVGKLVAEILARVGFNKLFDREEWREAMRKAEVTVNAANFVGAIVKWILVIVSLSIAVTILGFSEFNAFLNRVMFWLPNLIVATAIFVVGVVVADMIEKIIKVWVEKMGINYSGFIGGIAKWAIYIFSGMAILVQLGIAETLINTLLTGFVATLSLAFGLAFGLGGKEAAARVIQQAKDKLSK